MKISREFSVKLITGILVPPFVILVMLCILILEVDKHLLHAETYKTILSEEQVFDRTSGLFAGQMVWLTNLASCEQNPLTCNLAPPIFLYCAQNALGEERYSDLTLSGEPISPSDRSLLQPCLDQFSLKIESPALVNFPPFIREFTISDWEILLARLLPSQAIEEITDDSLDQFFQFLAGKSDQVTVSLAQFKTRLASGEGLAAINEILLLKPACTFEQMALIILNIGTGDPGFGLCNPPEEIMFLVLPLLSSELAWVSEQIPAEIVILDQSTGEIGSLIRQGYLWLRLFIYLGLLLPLLFIGLISVLSVRSIHSCLLWWGFPGFCAGLLTMAVGISLSPLFTTIWSSNISPLIPITISSDITVLIYDLTSHLTRVVAGEILLIGLAIACVGLIMWMISFFLKEKSRKPARKKSLEI